MFENIQNSFNGLFGKVAPGMCRLTMKGNIAVKCGNGYKSYNVKKGHFNGICAQLILAMCRYPVVVQIVKKCASRFDEINAEYGDDVRSVTLDHLVEQNSGN